MDGKKYSFILEKPFRWEEWAAPKGKDGQIDHNKAQRMTEAARSGGIIPTDTVQLRVRRCAWLSPAPESIPLTAHRIVHER